MTGYHTVRLFEIPIADAYQGFDLPEGWKPFASTGDYGVGMSRKILVLARKWERVEG